jgi:hypothetical protein
MRTVLFVVVAIAALLATGACTERESGFKSTRPELMSEMKIALTKSGIPFRESEDGFIRYDARYDEAIRRIRDEVEEEIFGGIAIRHDDEESVAYLKRLLSSKGLKYRVEVREDGEWIRWYPQSLEQQAEIDRQVAEHAFDSKCGNVASQCEEEKAASKK